MGGGLVELPCPHCKNECESKVIDSRDGYDFRRRRRKCSTCGKRFTTYEIMEADYQKINAVNIDVKEFDSVIASLRAIKAQFGQSNGTRKD